MADAWEKTAKEYNNSVNTMSPINGRSAQEHYKVTLKKHRNTTAKSAKASGVDEDVTELTMILDDAVELEDSLVKASEEVDKLKQGQVSLILLFKCLVYIFNLRV